THQHRLHHAEHQRIRADPNSERQNYGQSERRILSQCTQAVAQILEQVVHFASAEVPKKLYKPTWISDVVSAYWGESRDFCVQGESSPMKPFHFCCSLTWYEREAEDARRRTLPLNRSRTRCRNGARPEIPSRAKCNPQRRTGEAVREPAKIFRPHRPQHPDPLAILLR